MDSIFNNIRAIIEEPMEKMNITIDSISWDKVGNNNFLRIVLDRADGLDMDTIVEATNIINPIMDEHDLIKEQYILEISSKERGNYE